MDLSHYRPNVGVVLFHPDGRVWLGKRVDTPGPYNWQFPQGGIDEGEDHLTAAKRELWEETGVQSTEFLARTEDWIAYDFPPEMLGSKAAKGWKGQKQVWFALRLTGPESEIRLDHHSEIEFEAWRWDRLAATPQVIVPFKRPVYEKVASAFARFAEGA